MKSFNMNWGMFSIHRKALMGGAILFIMLYHSFHESPVNDYNRIIVTGKMGVEFFLFLSGIGLYFSLKKNNELKRFYERRLLRLLPEYLIVAIPVYLLYTYQKGLSLFDFLINISTINFFWGDGTYFWFIHLIIICYLLAPFYYNYVDGCRYIHLVPVIILILTYAVSFFYRDYQMILLRYASFFGGLGMGREVYQIKNNKYGRYLMVLAPLVIILWYASTYFGELDGLWLEPFYYFWLTIPLLIYMCYILKANNVVYKLFVFLGGISLEIYLLHEIFFLKGAKMLFSGTVVACVVSIITVIPFAWLLSKLNGRILRLIHK